MSVALYEMAANGGKLSDTLQRNDVAAHHFIFHIGKLYLLLVLLVFGLPFGGLWLAGKIDIWGCVFVLSFFGGGGLIFLAIGGVIRASVNRSRLPRTLVVKDGKLIIRTPKDRISVPITDCQWYIGDTASDDASMVTKLRRGLVIQTPESHFSVGYEHGTLEHWQSFLTLARIPQNPPNGCIWMIAVSVAGLIIGTIVGVAIGYVVSLITNFLLWRQALGTMGAMEGAAIALIYATCTFDGAMSARTRLHPLLVGVVFFGIGIRAGAIAGLHGALVCGAFNSLFGVLVAGICRVRIDNAESERKLQDQGRR